MRFSVFLLHVLPDDVEGPTGNIEALGKSRATDTRCLGDWMTVEQNWALLLPDWEINL